MLRQYSALFFALLLAVGCAAPVQNSAVPVAAPPELPLVGTSSVEPTPELAYAPTVDYTVAGEALVPVVIEICEEYKAVGMSLAVFDRQGVCYQQSYGYASRERNQPATADTRYRVASISKLVTSMIALDLVGQGKLDLDAPIGSYMGYDVVNPSYPNVAITTRQLMTHSSSIVDSSVYSTAVTNSTLPPISTVVPHSFGDYPPTTSYRYSNLGLGMVSGVIEGASGARFLDYTREQVFVPMGIDAAYSYTDIVAKDSVASLYSAGSLSADLHGWGGMSAKYNQLPLGNLYALGHGDLIITAADLARFGMLLAGCPQQGEPLELTPELLAAMQAVQYEVADTTDYQVDEIRRGLGTMITSGILTDRDMVGHQGNAYGCISGLFVDPASKTGFVLLTNGAVGSTNGTGSYLINQKIAEAVYAAFFGYAPKTE